MPSVGRKQPIDESEAGEKGQSILKAWKACIHRSMLSWLQRFRDLNWALQFNPSLRRMIDVEYHSRHSYPRYLDQLMRSLRNAGVKNIQEKIADANHLSKFKSIIAELKFASELAAKGKRVTLFSDNVWHGKSPDMESIDPNLRVLVEVKRLKDDESVRPLVDGLNEFLRQTQYAVDIMLKRVLSEPTLTRAQRQVKEHLAQKMLEQFKAQFAKADLTNFPVTIPTNEANFTVRASGLGYGYVGIVQSDVVRFDEDNWLKKFIHDIGQKAAKRLGWQGSTLDNPYVVAIDCQLGLFDEDTVKNALIGRTVTVHPSLPTPQPPLTAPLPRAIARGWRQFLLDECVLPNNRTYLPDKDRGAYFTESLMSNVSGVLARLVGDRSPVFVPNPFCEDRINDTQIVNWA